MKLDLLCRGAGLIVAGALSACGGGGGSGAADSAVTDPPVRVTSYGALQGVDDSLGSGTYFWKGVPFAKPPVASLRWRAPVEPDSWAGTRQTKSFAPACIQNGMVVSPGLNGTFDETVPSNLYRPVGSEDCLYLNIWRPSTAEKGLPVIFFIHGGSGVAGYTANPLYDGATLARRANAIVVTASYRLGPLGYFNLPQLKAGLDSTEASGNFALLDNLQALRFIQKNIEAFGGNPGNVTAMGQSAGAVNLWALLSSPLSAGLMHKVLPMSGGISLVSNLPAGSLPAILAPSASLAQANGLLSALLVQDGSAADPVGAKQWVDSRSAAQVADYLRSVDAGVLLGVLAKAGLTGSGPIPDGTVVPSNPIEALAAGRYPRLPVLATMTAEEGKLSTSAWSSPVPANRTYPIRLDAGALFRLQYDFRPDMPGAPSAADLIAPAYLPADAPQAGYNATAARITNGLFIPSRNNVLDTLAQQQSNVWYAQFDWRQNPAPWDVVYGAAHSVDLSFVFGNFGKSLLSSAIVSPANEPGRLALSNAMMASVAAFARTGDPNNAALDGVQWAPWPRQLHFDATQTERRISISQ